MPPIVEKPAADIQHNIQKFWFFSRINFKHLQGTTLAGHNLLLAKHRALEAAPGAEGSSASSHK
jgi:hypothetical protein